MRRPVLSSWDALLDYCNTAMSHGETENFKVLFLDPKNVLIADEQASQRHRRSRARYAQKVAKRVLQLNASAIILVHNHPSGDPTPSQSDITLVTGWGSPHDHLIIGKPRRLSFRTERLI